MMRMPPATGARSRSPKRSRPWASGATGATSRAAWGGTRTRCPTRPRARAAKDLGVSEERIKRDVGVVILALETLVAEQIAATLTPVAPVVTAASMSETEREAALALLRDPQLLDRILADFARAGVVGEETNTLVGYLAAVSRKLPEPLAIIIQSASAAGKTSLMDAVLAFVPPEERVQYSAITGQALFYMAETHLKHKVLSVAEAEAAEL